MFPAYLGCYSIQHTSQTRDLHSLSLTIVGTTNFFICNQQYQLIRLVATAISRSEIVIGLSFSNVIFGANSRCCTVTTMLVTHDSWHHQDPYLQPVASTCSINIQRFYQERCLFFLEICITISLAKFPSVLQNFKIHEPIPTIQ